MLTTNLNFYALSSVERMTLRNTRLGFICIFPSMSAANNLTGEFSHFISINEIYPFGPKVRLVVYCSSEPTQT